MLQQARALFHAEEAKGLRSSAASKIENIRHFDVEEMERAVAICYWGRSGTMLLASYLDGHDDVILLPTDCSERIYQFFERYGSLSLHDKLICYPVLMPNFFQGKFPVAAADYYAAINALFEVYGNAPSEFLESRRTFFQFLHIVYCVALGRRPVSRHPVIVYAQHNWDDELARRLVEDFPQTRFIHPVRDPITNCGRVFDYWYPPFKRNANAEQDASSDVGYKSPLTSLRVFRDLAKKDIPHSGMESRTCAIRFEDLHLHLERTMRRVADWLDLPYQTSLLESTFNGVPWVVKRGTSSWSGTRSEQANRDSQNVSFTDRGLLFAVLNEDFVAWNYPCPAIFRYSVVRIFTFALLLLLPTKIEIITLSSLIKPSLRFGSFRYAVRSFAWILICRVGIVLLLAIELGRRLIFGKRVFDLL